MSGAAGMMAGASDVAPARAACASREGGSHRLQRAASLLALLFAVLVACAVPCVEGARAARLGGRPTLLEDGDAYAAQHGAWGWPHGLDGEQWRGEGAHGLLRDLIRKRGGGRRTEPKSSSAPRYFGFLPKHVGSLIPKESDVLILETECFAEVVIELDPRGLQENGDLKIAVFLNERKEYWPPCGEVIGITSGDGIKLINLFFAGLHEITWSTRAQTTAEKIYLAKRGLHFFRFPHGSIRELQKDLVDTVALFEPVVTHRVPGDSAERNVDFLSRYSQIQPPMKRRTLPPGSDGVLAIDEGDIYSGDFFGIMRLDGLDPTIAWGAGSTTGHTAVALRNPETGALHVCEATAKSAYWPSGGWQCTPYADWLALAHAADYNVVWAPLSNHHRELFDESSAWAWFQANEGLEYGYANFLFSWIDTESGNYPCVPPDYETCLEWMFLEPLSGFVDRTGMGSRAGDRASWAELLWLPALNHRLGTEGLGTLEAYNAALERGIDPQTLVTQVEEDAWTYNLTRTGKDGVATTVQGPSLVCSAFVCSVWKAAGLFGAVDDAINCAEFTPFDVHALKVFDDAYAFPSACEGVGGDQGGVCQIMGAWTLHLNEFNTRDMTPHMAEKCPSLPPGYARPHKC